MAAKSANKATMVLALPTNVPCHMCANLRYLTDIVYVYVHLRTTLCAYGHVAVSRRFSLNEVVQLSCPVADAFVQLRSSGGARSLSAKAVN